jgi:hypothetical protein
MMWDQRRMDWRGTTFSLFGTLAAAGLVLAVVAGTQGAGTGASLDRLETDRQRADQALPARLAAIDHAIARQDLGRAVYEWRGAYGVALGTRRWEAMAAVGDAAMRVDALAGLPTGHPTGFRAEARQAYLKALFQARAARSREGIDGVADRFAALGDKEMAARARRLGDGQ